MNVYVCCNWCTPAQLCALWQKLLGAGDNVRLTDNPAEADMALVVNRPNVARPPALRADAPVLLVGMEPHMDARPALWGAWAPHTLTGADVDGWRVTVQRRPPRDLNFVEWHLRHTADELRAMDFLAHNKKNAVSVVLSAKHTDEGHALRVALVRRLQRYHADDVRVDVYGRANAFGLENFMGDSEVPDFDKTGGILPYRYHLAFENNSVPNYITEKLYDGVLMDSHCFYWGAPNAPSVFKQTPSLHEPAAFAALPVGADVAYMARVVVAHVKQDMWTKGRLARQNMRAQILDIASSQFYIPKLIAFK